MKIIVAIFLTIAQAITAFAQKNTNLLQGNNGVYTFLDEKAIGASFKNAAYDYVQLSSNISGSWAIIEKTQASATIADFKKQIGDENYNRLLQQYKLKTETELWKYLQENSAVNSYGFFAFNPSFMQAMGVLYIHKFDTKKYIGKTISYKLAYFKNNNKVKETESSITLVEKLNTAKPQLLQKQEADSAISAKWYGSKQKMNDIVFANMYKGNAKNEFSLFAKNIALIQGSNNNDSIVFSLIDRTTPGQLYKYYIVPTNYAGLEGTPSDTISLFSVNFENTPQAINLKAKDTTTGIYLSFTPPAPSPLIIGIIIQRSRFDKTGYAAIDTVPPASTNYLDEALLPNVQYYYQLTTLSIRQLPLLPAAWAGATHTNKNTVMVFAPDNVTAKPTAKGVLLSWEAQPQADIAGFRVYRANSNNEKLEPVSLLTNQNEFLDTTALDNRRQYVYAISCINYSDKESDLSPSVYASPINNIVLPATPVGIVAAAEPGRVLLNWRNAVANDAYIKGYRIYKKELQVNETIKNKNYTVEELAKSGFKLVNTDAVVNASYADAFNNASLKYQYYVTSVDIQNIESLAANGITVEIPATQLQPPGNFSVRKISTGIAISWDKSQQQEVTGYIIYRREVNVAKATPLTKLANTVDNYVDKTAVKNKTYYYTISASGKNNASLPGLEKGAAF
jgi:fibronectin type 3 domain-containing protein